MKPVLTFTKRIKETSISFKEIIDAKDIAKLSEVIQKLESLTGLRSSDLSELSLRTNPKSWAASSLEDYPNKIDKHGIQYLIADFTDSMQTRMRMDTKYALGILMENSLILCHSVYGEETITPEWKIIPRMLDADNVLRFVVFTKSNETIKVSYWEREATGSFVEWLGLPRKQVFLLGGNYKMRTEIDNMSVEFQMDEEEIGIWIKNHPEIRDGRIELKSPIHNLIIKEARAGRKAYDNIRDFIQDYEAETFGMPKYAKEYQRIKSSNLPLLMKFFDERERVIRVEGDDKTTEVEKSTPEFNILFADGIIEIRPSYLVEIANKIKNREHQKIFHAGHKFSSPPLVLGDMCIYNQIELNQAVLLLIEYYNQLTLQDSHLNSLFLFTLLKALEYSNKSTPFSYVFQEIANEIIGKLPLRGRVSKTEDNILEYKSRDLLSGNHQKIIDELGIDLESKLKSSSCKIYCIGIEDNGVLSPVNPSRIRSDRIEKITQGLKQRFPNHTLHVFPVIQGEEALVLLIIYS